MNEDQLDKEFIEALEKEDELGMTIKAHLDIEYWTNELLDLMVPHPEHLKPMKLDYFDKINLLCTLGLNSEYKDPLIYMGTTRNKFAHNLKYSIDKSVVNNFYKSFSENGKAIAKTAYDTTERSEENKKYKSFREMPPKDQFVFLAVNVRNMVKAAVYVARKKSA